MQKVHTNVFASMVHPGQNIAIVLFRLMSDLLKRWRNELWIANPPPTNFEEGQQMALLDK